MRRIAASRTARTPSSIRASALPPRAEVKSTSARRMTSDPGDTPMILRYAANGNFRPRPRRGRRPAMRLRPGRTGLGRQRVAGEGVPYPARHRGRPHDEPQHASNAGAMGRPRTREGRGPAGGRVGETRRRVTLVSSYAVTSTIEDDVAQPGVAEPACGFTSVNDGTTGSTCSTDATAKVCSVVQNGNNPPVGSCSTNGNTGYCSTGGSTATVGCSASGDEGGGAKCSAVAAKTNCSTLSTTTATTCSTDGGEGGDGAAQTCSVGSLSGPNAGDGANCSVIKTLQPPTANSTCSVNQDSQGDQNGLQNQCSTTGVGTQACSAFNTTGYCSVTQNTVNSVCTVIVAAGGNPSKTSTCSAQGEGPAANCSVFGQDDQNKNNKGLCPPGTTVQPPAAP